VGSGREGWVDVCAVCFVVAPTAGGGPQVAVLGIQVGTLQTLL
jgi:hypothetical protein